MAAGLLAGGTAEAVAAKEARPGAEQGSGEGMSREGLEKLVQFNHPEKQFGFLPGLNEEVLAGMYGIDLATYREIKGRFDDNAHRAALELLDDPSFAERVDRLPFGSGATVVGLGDSFTDDLQSWLEILRHLFEERRPQDGVRFANVGVSGYTTAMALRYFVPIVARRLDWIICFLGGNDATRRGGKAHEHAGASHLLRDSRAGHARRPLVVLVQRPARRERPRGRDDLDRAAARSDRAAPRARPGA